MSLMRLGSLPLPLDGQAPIKLVPYERGPGDSLCLRRGTHMQFWLLLVSLLAAQMSMRRKPVFWGAMGPQVHTEPNLE